MLKKSKLMSIVLALAFVLSAILPISASAAISFSDLPSDHTYYEAITNLAAEGIINGFDDGTYKPEDPVTRAQFTKIICYATDVGDLTYGEDARKTFSDVAPDHWAINNIITAKNAKIINGYDDGTFKPDNQVLYEQAVKMAACAIGYPESRVEREGGYPTAYLKFAQKQGLLSKVNGVEGEPLTRGKVAQLIDNMRGAKQIDSSTGEQTGSLRDETVTRSSVEGRIVAINKVALYHDEVSTTTCRNNQIEIEKADGTRLFFWIDNINVEDVYDYLGRTVTVHYDVDGESDYNQANNIVFKNNRNAEFVVDIEDVDTYTDLKLEYFDNNDEEAYLTIAPNVIIVHNGQSVNKTFSQIVGESIGKTGSIKLVCSNSADTADVAFVKTYETYVVNAVVSRTHTITDNYRSQSVVLNPDDSSKSISFYKNGTASSFSGISQGNIISVAQSDNGKIIEVQVSDKRSTGTVDSMINNKVMLKNGTKYLTFAPTTWNRSQVDVGVYVTFSLDAFGKIVLSTVNVSAAPVYGYLSGVEDTGNMGETILRAQIYKVTSSNYTATPTIYTFAERIKIDGSVYTVSRDANSIKTYLSTRAAISGMNASINGTAPTNATYAQPIRFIANGTTIESIITTATTGENNVSLNMNSYTTSAIECTTDKTVLGNYSLADSTPVILIPSDRAAGTYYTKNNSYFEEGEQYYVQIVNKTEANRPGAIYVYGMVGGGSSISTPSFSEEDAPMVVKEVIPEASYMGTIRRKLVLADAEGNLNLEVYKGDYENTSAVDTVAVGDIVRVAYDTDKFVTLIEEVVKYADITSGTQAGFAKDEDGVASTDQRAEYRVVLGYARNVVGNSIVMAPNFDAAVSSTETLTANDATKVYLVDSTNINNVVSASYITDIISYNQSATDASKIFVYTANGTVKMIIIYA